MPKKKSKEIYLNEIPEHWDELKGKYAFKQRNEKGGDSLVLLSPTQKYGVIPQELYEELSGMVAVKVNEKTNLSSFKTIKYGDYCISLRSFEGGFEYCLYNGVVSPAYTVFYCVVDGDKVFYKYLFKTEPFIREMNSYSLSLRDGKPISFDTFGKTCVPVPPLAEQKAIANFLDKKCGEIDEVSKIIESQIKALENYKKSIITESTFKGLNPNVEMADSGIQWVGSIPKHWDVLKGKYCFKNNKEVVGARVDDFERLALTLNGVIKRSKEDNTGLQPEKFNTYQILRKDELVFKLIDLQNVSTSRVGLSPYEGIVSGAYIILRAKENINPHFAEKYYLSMWMNQIFNYLGDAGVRSSLNVDDLLEIQLPVPPLAEQKAIANFLDKKCGEIDEIIESKRQQLKKIEEYKKSIVYEYVTGKKEVAYE